MGARQATAEPLTTRWPELTWRLEIVTVQGEEGERLHQLQRLSLAMAMAMYPLMARDRRWSIVRRDRRATVDRYNDDEQLTGL